MSLRIVAKHGARVAALLVKADHEGDIVEVYRDNQIIPLLRWQLMDGNSIYWEANSAMGEIVIGGEPKP